VSRFHRRCLKLRRHGIVVDPCAAQPSNFRGLDRPDPGSPRPAFGGDRFPTLAAPAGETDEVTVVTDGPDEGVRAGVEGEGGGRVLPGEEPDPANFTGFTSPARRLRVDLPLRGQERLRAGAEDRAVAVAGDLLGVGAGEMEVDRYPVGGRGAARGAG